MVHGPDVQYSSNGSHSYYDEAIGLVVSTGKACPDLNLSAFCMRAGYVDYSDGSMTDVLLYGYYRPTKRPWYVVGWNATSWNRPYVYQHVGSIGFDFVGPLQ